MGGIDTDTIGHDELGILGTNQLFLSKKSPTGTAVPMSHLKLLFLPQDETFFPKMGPLSQRWDICPNDGSFVRRNVMPLLLLLWDSETAVPAKKFEKMMRLLWQYWDICLH